MSCRRAVVLLWTPTLVLLRVGGAPLVLFVSANFAVCQAARVASWNDYYKLYIVWNLLRVLVAQSDLEAKLNNFIF